jgi:Fe-Mn family superoxide dismutase
VTGQPAASPATFADSAQRAAGVIAARHRGDLAGAEDLLESFETEGAKTTGFYLLAEITLRLLQARSGQTMEETVQELNLLLAAAFEPGACGP